jgi:Mrp family chromosome partitioning ATPase
VNGGGVEGLLEVLPAGTIPGDSADLLDNRVATALLGTLRDRADVVLVDSPAALPTTDAMVLATKVDAIIAIARTRLALRPEIVALRRALASVPALAIGFVFTGTSPKERIDYGGGYSVPARAPASPRLEEELTGAREATLR